MPIVDDKLIQNKNSASTSHTDIICDKFILNIDNNYPTKNCKGGSSTPAVNNSKRSLIPAIEDNTRRLFLTPAVEDNTRRSSSTLIVKYNTRRSSSTPVV